MSRRDEERGKELLVLELLESIAVNVERIVALLTPTATGATLGGPMTVQVGASEVATLAFTPAGSAPPTGDGSGLVVTFASDNEAVATVDAAVLNGETYTANVTGVSVGSFNLSATVANTSGAALLDNDGVTDFVQPAPLADSVTGPQATGATISVA